MVKKAKRKASKKKNSKLKIKTKKKLEKIRLKKVHNQQMDKILHSLEDKEFDQSVSGWIIFDVNGTLCKKRRQRSQGGQVSHHFRPGLEQIKRLEEVGFRIGLWSSSRKRNVPSKQIRERIGLEKKFFCILNRANCGQLPKNQRQNPWDTIKPFKRLEQAYPQILKERTIFVDDSGSKYEEVTKPHLVLIPSFSGAEGDSFLQILVDSILSICKTHSLNDVVEQVNANLFQELQKFNERKDKWKQPAVDDNDL